MSREELLEGVLEVINQNNETIEIGLQALRTNSETLRMLADELVNGAVSPEGLNPFFMTGEAVSSFPGLFETGVEELEPYADIAEEERDDETIEQFAQRIADKILNHEKQENEIQMVGIQLDVDRFEPKEVMELVQRILAGEDVQPPAKKKEDGDDEFDFSKLDA